MIASFKRNRRRVLVCYLLVLGRIQNTIRFASCTWKWTARGQNPDVEGTTDGADASRSDWTTWSPHSECTHHNSAFLCDIKQSVFLNNIVSLWQVPEGRQSCLQELHVVYPREHINSLVYENCSESEGTSTIWSKRATYCGSEWTYRQSGLQEVYVVNPKERIVLSTRTTLNLREYIDSLVLNIFR